MQEVPETAAPIVSAGTQEITAEVALEPAPSPVPSQPEVNPVAAPLVDEPSPVVSTPVSEPQVEAASSGANQALAALNSDTMAAASVEPTAQAQLDEYASLDTPEPAPQAQLEPEQLAQKQAEQQVAQQASNTILASFEQGGAPLVLEPEPEPELVEAEVVAPQQKSFSALAQISNDNWWQLVEELSVAGVSKSIALSCAIVQIDSSGIALVLDETQATLYNDVHLGRIKESFESYFECALNLVIDVAQVTVETPAQRKIRIASERLQRAQQIIANDNFVQALSAQMGAQIVPNSIAYYSPKSEV